MAKPTVINAGVSLKKLDERQFLASWKEIAEYMRCGVRTVQRYERQFGLPVRRPTGKSRGSVMATRAEIDAWVAAGPIRETFRLARVDQNSSTRSQAERLEHGVNAMRKLKDQMQELRKETRTVLNLLIDRVSAIGLLMPPARPNGYEPLVNMDMDDMEMDMDKRLRGRSTGGRDEARLRLVRSTGRRNRSRSQPAKAAILTAQKPH